MPVGGDEKMKDKLPSYFDFVKHIQIIVGEIDEPSESSSSSTSSEENGSPSDSLGDDISQFQNSDLAAQELKGEIDGESIHSNSQK